MARSIMASASRGLVANPTPSGTCAARIRSGFFVQSLGK